MSRQENVQDCMDRVYANFTYARDIALYGDREFWKDRSESILAGDDWQGDCEDCALSTGSILHTEYGIPKSDLFLWVVSTIPDGERMNHAILGVMIDGTMFICDNRYKKHPVPQGFMNYKYFQGLRMDKDIINDWFEYKEQ